MPDYCQRLIKQAIRMSDGEEEAVFQILTSYMRSDEKFQQELCVYLLKDFSEQKQAKRLQPSTVQAPEPSSLDVEEEDALSDLTRNILEASLGVSAGEATVVHKFISKIGYHPGAMGESLKPIQGSDSHKDTIRILAKAYVEKRYDDYAAKLANKAPEEDDLS